MKNRKEWRGGGGVRMLRTRETLVRGPADKGLGKIKSQLKTER